MGSVTAGAEREDETASVQYADAIVLGAGFAGICALYHLRDLGLDVMGIEAGSDVGGTWYWNRYPGARTDSEAWAYCYTFSDDLIKEWDWADRLPSQQQVLSYLGHVADRFDLRKAIEFNTRISSATFDESDDSWTLVSEDGRRFQCRYFIAATGALSAAYRPDFEGLDDFAGEWYMASSWPKDNVDLLGKRIAIIGSGSTGIQILPLAAEMAAHVSLFQRTPNYVLPARNYPLEKERREGLKANRVALRKLVQAHDFAIPVNAPKRTYDDVPDESERYRILEAGWEAGGFRFIFETFDDIFTDKRMNAEVTAFIRNKIRSIVRDPATAELLCPKYVFGAKRPPTGTAYYESFNRDNVSLIDVREQPIDRITKSGIKAGDQEYPFDIIIFATGFEAATGAFRKMDIRGRGGICLKDKWGEDCRTNLGIMVDDFPNMFMIIGPQSPFANTPPVIENVVAWIAKTIRAVRLASKATVEPTEQAVDRWNSNIQDLFKNTLFSAGADTGAWFLGVNIPGRSPSVLFHFGGTNAYFADLDDALSRNLEDFILR